MSRKLESSRTPIGPRPVISRYCHDAAAGTSELVARPPLHRATQATPLWAEVLASRWCGCFYCRAIFPPSEIKDWIDPIGEEGKTALCAKCGIDSVIGDRSGFPITPEFLERMNHYWF